MTALLEKQLNEEEYFSRKAMLIRSLQEWIAPMELDYLVTLTFKNEDISEIKARSALKLFIIRLNKRLFGNRPKSKVSLLPFQEKNYVKGIHFHIMVKIPVGFCPIEIQIAIKDSWISLKEHGYASFKATNEYGEHMWFLPIYDNQRLTKYVTKQAKNSSFDNLVVEHIHIYK